MNVSEADLAWLAGVIDSEGTVSLVANPRPQLRVSIYNSSDLILDKVATILHDCDVKWHEHVDRRAVRVGYGMHIGTAGAMKLYPLVRPYMVRQVNRYDAGYWFHFDRRKLGRRHRWTDHDNNVWRNLRELFNAR